MATTSDDMTCLGHRRVEEGAISRRNCLCGLATVLGVVALAGCGSTAVATQNAGTSSTAAASPAVTTTSAPSSSALVTSVASSTSSAAPATAAATSATASAGTVAAAAGVPSTCTQPMDMLSNWTQSDDTGKGIAKVVQEWTAIHGQCTINLTAQQTSNQAIDVRLVTLIAGGTPPPLVTAIGNNVGNWVARGLIDQVDDLFKTAGLTGDDFFPPIWQIMDWQGKVRLVPLMMDANFPLFWNTETVREVGIDPTKGPTTVDELDQMGQKLTKISGSQIDRLPFTPWDWYGLQNSLLTAGLMFGGSFYDEANQKLTFDDPNVVRGMEWIAGWAQRLNYKQAAQLIKGSSWPAQLAVGKLAIAPLVSANVPTVYQKNPDAKLAYGPLPASPPGTPGVIWTGCWSIATVPGSNRRDDAWSFMRYIGASPEGTLAVARDIGGLPGYKKSPGLDYLAKDPNTAAHVEGAKRAKFLRPEFYTQILVDYTPLNAVLDGTNSAKSALQAINQKAQATFDQVRSQTAK